MHTCSQCQLQFDSEAEYLNHLCSETGVTPTQPESMGPNHDKISAAALARGAAQSVE